MVLISLDTLQNNFGPPMDQSLASPAGIKRMNRKNVALTMAASLCTLLLMGSAQAAPYARASIDYDCEEGQVTCTVVANGEHRGLGVVTGQLVVAGTVEGQDACMAPISCTTAWGTTTAPPGCATATAITQENAAINSQHIADDCGDFPDPEVPSASLPDVNDIPIVGQAVENARQAAEVILRR